MKFTLSVVAVASLLSTSLAANCTPGLNYCGKELLNVGDYTWQIDQCNVDNGFKAGSAGTQKLYHCVGGPYGALKFVKQCKSCHISPSGQSDYCAS